MRAALHSDVLVDVPFSWWICSKRKSFDESHWISIGGISSSY
jgi:hypothetical protein